MTTPDTLRAALCSAIWNGCRCARRRHEGGGHVWRNSLDGDLVDPAHYPPLATDTALGVEVLANTPGLLRAARAELLRVAVLEARCIRGQLHKVTNDDFAIIIDVLDSGRLAALAADRGAGMSAQGALAAALHEAIAHIELYPTHDEGCPWSSWDPDSRTFRICLCSHADLLRRLRAAFRATPTGALAAAMDEVVG